MRDTATGTLQLRIEIAGRNPELGAGFEDADAGDLQWQVLTERGIDGRIQGGIVERRPPVGELARG